jgi:hypothetical protein
VDYDVQKAGVFSDCRYALLALKVKLGFLVYYDLYGISWRFFSLRERV